MSGKPRNQTWIKRERTFLLREKAAFAAAVSAGMWGSKIFA
jgi:hypothetical protein